MANKLTKKDYFNGFIAKYPLTADEIAFCEHELELLEKKNSRERGMTETQKLNVQLADVIVDHMNSIDGAYTVTDMIKNITEIAECSNQKVSRIANDLVKDGRLVKFVDKRKTFFAKA